MKEFNFEKRGYKFFFRNPKLNEYNNLYLEFKIKDIKENKQNDGYFGGARLNVDKKAIEFAEINIGDKKIGGVYPPENVYKELEKLYNDLIVEKNRKIEEIVDSIIAGETLIDWSIVGCDWPHYHPWLRDLPEDLKGLEQYIMEKAIEKMTGDIFISNSCEYLERKLKQDIATKEYMNPKALNLRFDEEVQKYYGYKREVITGFQMKLEDIVDIESVRKKIEEERKRKEEIEKKRKSLIIEVISKGKEYNEDVDFYAKVKLTSPETGESLSFICRNIFDAGYVINPDYEIVKGERGGIAVKGYWEIFESGKGWYPVRELTEFEKKCIDYLNEFPPISTAIRL